MRIRRSTKSDTITTEQLTDRSQLRMHFQSYNCFVFVRHRHSAKIDPIAHRSTLFCATLCILWSPQYCGDGEIRLMLSEVTETRRLYHRGTEYTEVHGVLLGQDLLEF